MIEQVLLRGRTVAVDPLGDLDVAMQGIGHQVYGVVLAGEIVHDRQHFSVVQGRVIPACSMSSMEKAVIVDALRTPIGRYAGALKDVRPDDLASLVVSEVERRNQLDPASIEDVYFGDANQAGEDNRNVARMAVLLAGLPVEIPAATMN